jgi:hypothetical protein
MVYDLLPPIYQFVSRSKLRKKFRGGWPDNLAWDFTAFFLLCCLQIDPLCGGCSSILHDF